MSRYDPAAISSRTTTQWPNISRRVDRAVLARSLPLALFALLAAIPFIWNHFVGLSWREPDVFELALALPALGAISFYAWSRNARRLAEASAFLLLYLLYPLFGIKLSYLAATLNFPLIDPQISHLDGWLGFQWQGWALWETRHQPFLPLQAMLYQSHLIQIACLAVTFGFVRPATRNFEMLFLLILTLFATILVMALFPTLGPASLAHIVMPHEKIFRLLRSGYVTNLVYRGIISFPSYHTIMAIIFVYCSRTIKILFPAMLVWNAAMLFTVPYGGDHYLSDMLAGAAIAALAIALSRPLYAAKPGAAPPPLPA